MPYNIIFYFRLLYFPVSNGALFSTQYFNTLILYRRSLDTFYLNSTLMMLMELGRIVLPGKYKKYTLTTR